MDMSIRWMFIRINFNKNMIGHMFCNTCVNLAIKTSRDSWLNNLDDCVLGFGAIFLLYYQICIQIYSRRIVKRRSIWIFPYKMDISCITVIFRSTGRKTNQQQYDSNPCLHYMQHPI